MKLWSFLTKEFSFPPLVWVIRWINSTLSRELTFNYSDDNSITFSLLHGIQSHSGVQDTREMPHFFCESFLPSYKLVYRHFCHKCEACVWLICAWWTGGVGNNSWGKTRHQDFSNFLVWVKSTHFATPPLVSLRKWRLRNDTDDASLTRSG